MIKANELRIGNLLFFYKPLIQEAQILVVTGMQKYSDVGPWYIQSDTYSEINENGLMGIPLMPEWLERMGFVKDRNGWHLPETQISLTEELYPCWLDRMLWPQDIPDFKHMSIQYVHQLQNLYFTLTGQELTIAETA